MPVATVTGLASGIQWDETIDMMMQIEAQPMDRLLEQKDEIERKKSAWDSIQSKLESFQSTSKEMDTRNELLKKTATSSNTDKLTVSANANAISSSHTVIINQLAQAEVEVHTAGWADLSSTSVTSGGTGQFVYNFAGTDYTVSVPSGSTLIDLVSLINDDSNNPGVVASTIDDGGATNPIHLVLTSRESGSNNTIQIQDSTDLGPTGTEFDSGTFTETQNALDAEIRVDGFPTASWITRESNTIDDVIEGVTLTLKDTSATGISIQITEDLDLIKTKVQDWVDSYNDVMNDIALKTSYDADNEISGVLMGDGQLYSVRSTLQEIVSAAVPGLPSGSTYTNLSSVGINLGTDSALSIDDSELQDALENDLDAVVNLFVFSNSSTSNTLSYFTRTEMTKGGSYDVQAAYGADGKLDPNGTNTIGGYAATVENDYYLVGKVNTPVEGLRIRFSNPGGGAGTTSATIRIGTGVSVMVSNETDILTDSVDGLFTLVKDSYDDQIERIDEQVEDYQRRLDMKRAQLEKDFMAMESAVSLAQNQGAWLSSIG